jgi:hypothetical protein
MFLSASAVNRRQQTPVVYTNSTLNTNANTGTQTRERKPRSEQSEQRLVCRQAMDEPD